jgi:uncharacterized protein (DUF342 family)
MVLSVSVQPYTLSITDDELEAWINFNSEEPLSLDHLRRAIASAGIVCGLDTHLLADLAEARQAGHNYRIARAILPEEGIDYCFSRTLERTPKRLPDGRVDFYNLETIQNVVKQQILAAKIPPELCKPGQTVTGKEIPPSRAPGSLPQAGPNVALSEDGNALIALINGHPVLSEKQLRVDPTYVHEGDVDFSIGNITCIGNLVISGDVKGGFSVKGAQDVTVHGVVDGGAIHAGGGVYLHGNVFGKQKSEIYSALSVYGTYVDSAVITSQEDIILSRGARRSWLKAARRIIMQGHGSAIMGGTAQACDQIVSYDLGSEREIPTQIEILPGAFEATTSLRFLQQLTVLLEADQVWLRDLSEAQPQAASYAAMYQIGQRCLRTLPELIAYCEKRPQLCAQAPKPLGTVLVMGTAYPGVSICIGTASWQLNQPMTNVMFYQEDGAIQVRPLDGTELDGVRAE